MTPIANLQVQSGQLPGQTGIEPEDITPCLDVCVAPLNQIDRSGHGTQVDTLRGGAALNIRDVALQGFAEEHP